MLHSFSFNIYTFLFLHYSSCSLVNSCDFFSSQKSRKPQSSISSVFFVSQHVPRSWLQHTAPSFVLNYSSSFLVNFYDFLSLLKNPYKPLLLISSMFVVSQSLLQHTAPSFFLNYSLRFLLFSKVHRNKKLLFLQYSLHFSMFHILRFSIHQLRSS